jgi:Ca2+-binding RTX toxin-like protein
MKTQAPNKITLSGTGGGETLTGTEFADLLDGLGGDDVLHGLGGDDALIGGAGDDAMHGNSGNDVYYVDAAGDQVFESAGEGNDRIAASASYALAAGAEVETIETLNQNDGAALNLFGNEFAQLIVGNNGANLLDGGASDDVLVGLGGNDALLGGSGSDTMYGGLGDDVYYVQDSGDQVFENGGEGSDRIATSISFALASGSEVETIETITQSDTTALNIYGSEYAQLVIGNNGVNLLDGGGGNDVLVGLGGNDALLGGSGNDTMYGGLGDDVYYVQDSGDQVFENGGEGSDRIAVSISFALASGSEVETIETITQSATDALNLYGSEYAQLVIGNNGVNLLDGGGGNDVLVGLGGSDALLGGSGSDTMYGGLGDDVYYVQDSGDQVFENGGEGSDRIAVSISFALASGSEVETIETITQSDTTALNIIGSEYAQLVIGNNGANLLDGGGGDDVLLGLGGNDALLGGSGNDAMHGGLGDDVYYVQDSGDQAFENGGEGSDRVAASVSFALAAGSEIETLETIAQGDSASLHLTGNEFAQTVIGNAGANLLDGGAGNDVLVGLGGNDALVGGAGADLMYGGGSNDTYYVQDAGDQAIEFAGEGSDRVAASISFALAAGSEIETIETLNQSDSSAINLTGNEFGQTIAGNIGNNVLDGGGGNDTLFGGSGNDVLIGGAGADIMEGANGDDLYFVDNAADVVREVAFGGNGNDRAVTSVSYVLGALAEVETIEAISLSATDALNITGSNYDNRIVGNNGANVLDGGFGGLDTLVGAGGADIFAFTSALDASNVDTIADFQVGIDKIRLAGGPGEPFAALASGTLAAGAFMSFVSDPYGGASIPQPGSGPVPIQGADPNDYIIYNRSSGKLYYDADGAGGAAAVQFATLSAGLDLTAADFIVSGPANNAPTVTSGAAASVVENSATSTIVYQAVATDADGDRITWSLTGTNAGLLTIDANGAVRLLNPADFETRTSYSFSVVASDSASSTARAVTLTVTDVNDTPTTPIINETASANDAIGQSQTIARDVLVAGANPNLFDDDFPSATITGSISAPGDKDFFSITLQAGELLVLDVDGTSGGLDSFLTIYGPNLQKIGENDDQISFDPGSQPTIAQHNTDSQIRFRAATGGTYYFSIESFSDDEGATSSGGYQLHVSVGPQATAQQLVQEDIDALVSGSEWDHTNLTYGFPTSATQYPASFTEPDDGFSPFTSAQQAATRQLLQLVANVSSLTFTENLASPGQADLRYAMSNEPEVAYAYYPTNGGPNSLGGSAWFNHEDFNQPVRGSYDWMGILHETGHALGLKHGHEFPLALSADRDSTEYSVMTYRSFPGDDAEGYNNETWGYPQTLMMYDIAGLQAMYGANFAYNSGNSVYTWSPTTGEMSINGAGQGAPGGGIGGSANRVFLTIWDGGGTDTYDMSNYSANLTVDLRPGEWSRLDPVQLANLGSGHIARGNVANALLYQGNTASLIENGIGGSGNDQIYANQAANQLTGNGGADTFRWASASDGALADTIADFLRGTDKINLSGVDAVAGTSENEGFTFIDTAAFTNTAGQLRYEVIGGHANVFADTDGNGVADMQIVVNNITTLSGSDFVF